MCDAVREAISALFDEEQTSLTETALERHLLICANCRAFRAAVPALNGRLGIRRLDPPAGHANELSDAQWSAARTNVQLAINCGERGSFSKRSARVAQLAAAVVPLAIAVPSIALELFSAHIAPAHLGHCTALLLIHLRHG